jgi:hypothetical protein
MVSVGIIVMYPVSDTITKYPLSHLIEENEVEKVGALVVKKIVIVILLSFV